MKKSKKFLFAIITMFCIAQSGLSSDQPTAKPLELQYLTTSVGPSGDIEARAISANGKVVVGSADFKAGGCGCDADAFAWSSTTGMIDINNGAVPWSWASAVNADGTVIAGILQYTMEEHTRPFRWTAETGLVDLIKANPQLENFYPVALSANGTIMAGRVHLSDQGARTRGAIVSNGALIYLASQQDKKENSNVTAMTPNGEIVVGNIDVDGTGNRAFLWKKNEGMKDITTIKGRFLSSYATGVSADGSVVVGSVFVDGIRHAFRWTEKNGMKDLGALTKDEDESLEALSVSENGAVVFGISSRRRAKEYRLFQWSVDKGMVDLGPAPGNIDKSNIEGASSDGNILTGSVFRSGLKNAFVLELRNTGKPQQ
ncbi:hypothetical protein [Glaciimonas immobilis]|uniref:Putative HAF family extracellular repeat protein n=1 Tax=Glaciimonas immobilis TaxID=728004 RepID=A0A840RVL4_9BURK|nr:hypothetical protein [Glaciimonas immobilis]KAF3997598.1 hypothetical protein HAV38_13085 [Glaciimonas immobilis]MBB5200704.1 putative HAF family extracellular repeat protein [Glaciimonas immobilis]